MVTWGVSRGGGGVTTGQNGVKSGRWGRGFVSLSDQGSNVAVSTQTHRHRSHPAWEFFGNREKSRSADQARSDMKEQNNPTPLTPPSFCSSGCRRSRATTESSNRLTSSRFTRLTDWEGSRLKHPSEPPSSTPPSFCYFRRRLWCSRRFCAV